MGINLNILTNRFFCCLLVVFSAISGSFAYEVSIGAATIWPGMSTTVPVLLDDATDVATIQLQINYDPQLLTFVSVTNASSALGSMFTFDYEDDDGVLTLLLYREEGLVSGSGELVSMEFSTYTGAEVEMESVLVLVDVGLGDQNGKDLLLDTPVVMAHGSLTVYPSGSMDSDGDGLPDQWEYQYSGGITNLLASANDDGDALGNLDEYIAGLNPTKFDEFEAFLSANALSPVIYWNSVSGRVYNVYWATNLLDKFTLIQSNVYWSAGSYTDQVHNAESQGFYKIDVRLEP